MSDLETSAPVRVSEAAATRAREILAGESPGSMLRVAVKGGGCSGFQYVFSIAAERESDDLTIATADDAPLVIIDSLSAEMLAGSILDFVDDMMGQSFQLRNPNATASCGCGASFAL